MISGGVDDAVRNRRRRRNHRHGHDRARQPDAECPVSISASAAAMFVTGNSAPPDGTQIGLPQCAFAVAIVMADAVPIGPSGCNSPSAVRYRWVRSTNLRYRDVLQYFDAHPQPTSRLTRGVPAAILRT